MKLFTKAQMNLLLKNGAQANLERRGEAEADLARKPIVKLFTPWGVKRHAKLTPIEG